jgi:hypothetical protein
VSTRAPSRSATRTRAPQDSLVAPRATGEEERLRRAGELGEQRLELLGARPGRLWRGVAREVREADLAIQGRFLHGRIEAHVDRRGGVAASDQVCSDKRLDAGGRRCRLVIPLEEAADESALVG